MYHNATKLYKIMSKDSTGVRTKAYHDVNDGDLKAILPGLKFQNVIRKSPL